MCVLLCLMLWKPFITYFGLKTGNKNCTWQFCNYHEMKCFNTYLINFCQISLPCFIKLLNKLLTLQVHIKQKSTPFFVSISAGMRVNLLISKQKHNILLLLRMYQKLLHAASQFLLKIYKYISFALKSLWCCELITLNSILIEPCTKCIKSAYNFPLG